jgi:O-antigen/teichoic acid export membrane protein
VLLLALVAMVLWKPSHLLQGVLAGRERFKRLAALNAAATVVMAAAGLAVLALGGDLVDYVAVGAIAGALAGFAAWRLSGLSLQQGVWDRDVMRGLVRGGMPYFAWNVVRRVYGDGDRILLGFFSTQAAIGWYAAAYRIASVPLVFSTFITAPLMPVLTRHLSDTEVFQRTLRRTLLACLLFSVPCSGADRRLRAGDSRAARLADELRKCRAAHDDPRAPRAHGRRRHGARHRASHAGPRSPVAAHGGWWLRSSTWG